MVPVYASTAEDAALGKSAANLTAWRIEVNQYLQQSVAAAREMSNMMRRMMEEHELQGYDVTVDGDTIFCAPGPARLAYDKLYPTFNQGGFFLFRQGFEAGLTHAHSLSTSPVSR